MQETHLDASSEPRTRMKWIILVFVAAVLMGIPTLGGGFVGGDDHRLVLNHVLVNRPSWSHAAELFAIVHRDLYQPLPLLSFSAEFLVAGWLGIDRQGPEGFAWLFHLDNILLHAFNAVLVWLVIRTLHRRIEPDELAVGSTHAPRASRADIVATAAALLFAIHPLQTETVAWVNGRMMLMSTMFALASLLSFASLVEQRENVARRSPARNVLGGVLTILFVLLSGISKVRVGLVVLLLVVAVAHRSLRSVRAISVWLICAVMTALLAWVNIEATAGAELFSGAAEQLHGPRVVRVLLALACYIEHLVWPAGLASYYPTPRSVSWSDAATIRAVAVVVPVLFLLGWACVRSQVARLGVLWAASTLASTLPIIPARNILAADRYMYLPIIGLLWIGASFGAKAYRSHFWRDRVWVRRAAAPAVAVGVFIALIATCWHVAWYYADPLRKTARIAMLFPDEPRVWERLGWAHYKVGHYQRAMEFAARELDDDAPSVQTGAYQLLGMCELKRGNGDEAVRLLEYAIVVDPDTSLGRYRLAIAYDELGRLEDSVPYYEAAVEAAPLHDPTIKRLAMVYRRLNRAADARSMYTKVLGNNPYDVTAAMGTAEMDLALHTTQSLRAAEVRLRELLAWMPEHASARVNLGAVLHAMGRVDEAVSTYEHALREDPGNVTAAMNLGQIFRAAGDEDRAGDMFRRAVAGGLDTVAQAVIVHDYFLSRDDANGVRSLWRTTRHRFPNSTEVRVWSAWARALLGNLPGENAMLSDMGATDLSTPLAVATSVYVALARSEFDEAAKRVDTLCDLTVNDPDMPDARQRLLAALERFDAKSPDNAWTYCLAATLLLAEEQITPARGFTDLCAKHCGDGACETRVTLLLEKLDAPRPTP